MERNRNWLGIVAVALAGLALVVAIGGRFGPGGRQMAYYYGQAPQAPAAPQAPQAPLPPMGEGRFERGPDGFHGRGGPESFGPGFHGRGGPEGFGPGFAQGRHGFGHGFGPLGMIFGLVNFLTKVAALGLLAWLLLRLFQQRQVPPAAPAGPTTPAGHDPRVE